MEIQIVIQCPGRFTEVLPEQLESTELVIEDCVSQALVELFDIIVVNQVNIHYLPSRYRSEHYPSTLDAAS